MFSAHVLTVNVPNVIAQKQVVNVQRTIAKNVDVLLANVA